MKYIALLRGINVSGQKMIKMAALAKLFESLKFSSVRTYIQSGNVVFDSRASTEGAIVRRIETALQGQYGFAVPVILRSEKDWTKIINANPFLVRKGINEARLYVAFLRDKIERKSFPELDPYRRHNEEFVVTGREIYLHYPEGFGTTKLTNQIFEQKLGTVATTRNLNTLYALTELLG